jgi:hypothetical protein
MSDLDYSGDSNDGAALVEAPPSCDRWNPDGLAFPMVCNITKEILDAVDKLGIALNKEVTFLFPVQDFMTNSC